ncbi:MAG: T9SS type A sorting domain-containing protein [Ignavibacteriae bacterium]|nr:T9SS type A sorting domain-containing protein [Ignavibacteriota bacterium]
MKTQLLKLQVIISSIILLVVISTTLSQAQLLNGPQKIVTDAKRNRLFASNGNAGKLVMIDSTGTQRHFIDTAGFIDGLEIVGDTIYGVADNRVIKAYNLITKQLVMNITLTGGVSTNYLSSITSDSAGHLFISCPDLNAIYKLRISDRAFWTFAQNGGLNRPNGILLERDKNRIVIIDDSPPPSMIHAISLLDSTVSNLDTTAFNSPDGIVRDKNGYYYVGGYYLTAIYRFRPDFSGLPVPIFYGSHMVYPTYDYNDHSLLITFYDANTWARIFLPVGINDPEEHIKDFQLHQNYPNPFNPSTNIKFQIKKNSFVSLKVYNLLGMEIATLVNEKLPAGTYETRFSINSLTNKQLTSGVYFYKLETNGFSETRQMILLK